MPPNQCFVICALPLHSKYDSEDGVEQAFVCSFTHQYRIQNTESLLSMNNSPFFGGGGGVFIDNKIKIKKIKNKK